jgi:hypothetical protein
MDLDMDMGGVPVVPEGIRHHDRLPTPPAKESPCPQAGSGPGRDGPDPYSNGKSALNLAQGKNCAVTPKFALTSRCRLYAPMVL